MKHEDLIRQMSLEEKCYLLSGKDFWQMRSVERLGVPSMTLSDGPHGVRKQGEGDQLGLNVSLPATCYPTAAAIAKMTGGICTMEMAQGILAIVNGRFFKGPGAVIGGFSRAGKKRKTRTLLDKEELL